MRGRSDAWRRRRLLPLLAPVDARADREERVRAAGKRVSRGASRRLPFALAVASLLVLAGSAGASSEGAGSTATARAFGIRVVAPGIGTSGAGDVGAPPDASQALGGFSFAGGAVSTGSVNTGASASRSSSSASASATSEVNGISLFGGEVTIGQVSLRASSAVTAGAPSGDVSSSTVSDLVVLGTAASAPPGASIPLGDWGYAVTLAQSASPSADGYAGSVTGVDVRLTTEHGGLPAGTSIQIGYAEVSAEAPRAPLPPIPRPSRPRVSKPSAPAQPAAPPGSEPSGNTRGFPRTEPVPPGLALKMTGRGYVFPLYGPASFVDTFGAARATTGWHHGQDIFAPLGAPVLALTRGTLFSVGWNDVGGNRLWLRDPYGTEYYYAHMLAFAPAAVNGARVEPGTVIGFVGNTGDAQGTPFHLHLEIHPAALKPKGYDGVISPYRFLVAWRRLEDIRISGAAWSSLIALPSRAPTPGAYLLSASDISRSSGLDPGSLRRALAETASAAGDGGGTGAAPEMVATRRDSPRP